MTDYITKALGAIAVEWASFIRDQPGAGGGLNAAGVLTSNQTYKQVFYTMPLHTEPSANNALGGLLQAMMPRSSVRSENTQVIAGFARQAAGHCHHRGRPRARCH